SVDQPETRGDPRAVTNRSAPFDDTDHRSSFRTDGVAYGTHRSSVQVAPPPPSREVSRVGATVATMRRRRVALGATSPGPPTRPGAGARCRSSCRGRDRGARASPPGAGRGAGRPTG